MVCQRGLGQFYQLISEGVRKRCTCCNQGSSCCDIARIHLTYYGSCALAGKSSSSSLSFSSVCGCSSGFTTCRSTCSPCHYHRSLGKRFENPGTAYCWSSSMSNSSRCDLIPCGILNQKYHKHWRLGCSVGLRQFHLRWNNLHSKSIVRYRYRACIHQHFAGNQRHR